MEIEGVTVNKISDGAIICGIESFSDDLKGLIRANLAAISHGKATASEPIKNYSYKNTLRSFIDRYSTKDDNTKKGIIGELLAHILIPELISSFTSLSILFNKEERSIKKGFDIIYCDLDKKFTWYSEVKSGHKGGIADSDTTAKVLFERARVDLRGKFLEGRDSLWNSALTDVTLVLGTNKKAITVKKLLSEESPINNSEIKSINKNAILISVLYESLKAPVSNGCVESYLKGVVDSKDFGRVIALSIQKETYEAVASFLEEESQDG